MLAAEPFCKRADVSQVILVIAAEDQELFQEKFAASAALLGVEVIIGGAQRAESVLNGLRRVRSEIPWVAIHDAARPCIDTRSIDAVFAAVQTTEPSSLESLLSGQHLPSLPQATAQTSGQTLAHQLAGAILALPCNATLKRAKHDQTIDQTLPREGVWLAQTPQVFRKELLIEAYQRHPNPASATDDAAIIEHCGYSVRLVEGSPLNIKVTRAADMRFAELAMRALPGPQMARFD